MDNRRRSGKQKGDERGKPTVSGTKRKRGCKSKKTNHETISSDSETASGCRRRKGKMLAETYSSSSSCEDNEHSREDKASSEYTSDGSTKPSKKRNDERRRRSRKEKHYDFQHKLVDEASSDGNSDGRADARKKKTARNAKARTKRPDDRKHRGVEEAASDESPRAVKKKKSEDIKGKQRNQEIEDFEEPSKGSTWYRCHLSSTIKEVKSLKYEERHLREIKKTPFWLLFNALYKSDAAKLVQRCKKFEGDIRMIIKAYEETSEQFIVGGRYVSLTDADVELILGITGGGEPISLKRKSDKYPRWVKRVFADEIGKLQSKFILYKSTILEKISTLLQETDGASSLDVARLTHCYLLAAIIAPNKNSSMAPQYSFCLENFNEICEYNWCGFVISVLKKQMTTGKSNRVGGCTILLPFWLCEHTYLVKPVSKYTFPRFLRWDLKDLNKKLLREGTSIPKLPFKYVNREELEHTPLEQEILGSLMKYWATEGKTTQTQCESDGALQGTGDNLVEGGSHVGAGENTGTLEDETGTLDEDECVAATFPMETPPRRTSPTDETRHNSDNRSDSPHLGVGKDSVSTDTISYGQDEHDQDKEGILNDSQDVRGVDSVGPVCDGQIYKSADTSCPNTQRQHSEINNDISENERALDASLGVSLQKGIDSAVEYGMVGASVMKVLTELEECRARILKQDALLLEKDKMVEERSSLLMDMKKLSEERDSLLLVNSKLADVNNKLVDERGLWLLNKDRLVVVEKELEECRLKFDAQNTLLNDKSKVMSDLQDQMEYMREQLNLSVTNGIEKDKEIDKLKVEILRYRDARKIEMTNKMKEYVYMKWEAAKTAIVSNYEANLKALGDQVESLKAENEELKMRINCPSTTQILEDPNTLARLDAVAALCAEKGRNDILEQTCANLIEKLDLLAEVEDFTGVVGSKSETPCAKQAAKNDPPSPNSMVKKVKERTANDDRLKKAISPGPSTNEILELDADFATEVGRLEQRAVFRWDRKYHAVKHSSEHVKNYLTELFNDHGPTHIIWSGEPDYNRVRILDVFAILHNERINSPVIDSWANLLRLVAVDKLGTSGAKVFSSQSCDLISNRKNFTKSTLDTFLYSGLNEVHHEDVLLFPILAKGHRRTGDHWTLLVLDLGKGEWVFLNPLRPRNSDPHLDSTLELVEFIERELRDRFKSSKPDHILMKGPLKKPRSSLFLQQKPGTLDCGIVVCFHIENFILKRDLEAGKLKGKKAGAYRKKMVEWFCEPLEITLD